MSLQLDDLAHGLNGRATVDGVIVALFSTMGLWLDALRGPAQELAFWGTVVLVLGRLVLLALDFRDRHRRNRLAESFTGER